MPNDLPVQNDFSLRALNTFGIDAQARAYLQVESVAVLQRVRLDPELACLPRLVLGGGSNLLLTGDFPGLVLHMVSRGIEIVGQDGDDVAIHVRAQAGESWHGLVQWTLAHGIGGLENLSLIPGSVGASPIQNIGAYGVEAGNLIAAVHCFDFATGETFVLDHAGCEFGYRDSVFKHRLRDRAVILDVTFALPIAWKANLQYAELHNEVTGAAGSADASLDPVRIGAAVTAIRTRKLPDPAVIGNAGSFFKNPVVSVEQRDQLLAQWPQLVNYPQADGSIKLAAGWLIDQCGWKGRSLGAAGVYEKQALVLVNRGNASGAEIVALATAIQIDVAARFSVTLEPEPIFV